MIWLLGGYMWLFIHRPFEVWPALGAYHVERVYMLVTIAYWLLAVDKKWTKNRLNVGFLCLAAVIVASSLMSPYSEAFNQTVQDWLKVAVFFVLVMSTVRTERELQLLVIMFVAAMALYMGHSFREFLCGRAWYRMGVKRMVGVDVMYSHPNSFGPSVLYALPMVMPLWYLAKRQWQRGLLLAYIALSVTCVLLTASRTAFIGLCLISLLFVLFSRHRVKLALAIVLAAPLVWGALGSDLHNRYLTLIDSSYSRFGQLSAESRGAGFEAGLQLWREHPVLGVGPFAFRTARTDQFQGLASHNLYGQVLGELGTCGAVAMLLIVLGFAENARHMHCIFRGVPPSERPFVYYVSVGTSVTVVLLFVMGWGAHNLYRYTWLWFGAFQALALSVAARHGDETLAQEPTLRTTLSAEWDELEWTGSCQSH